MNIKITGSHILALMIVLAIAAWMHGGEILSGGQQEGAEGIPAIAERAEENTGAPFKVSYVAISPTMREQAISMRGRTKSDQVVPIRAETSGVIEKRLVQRGDFVKAGDLVCLLDAGARKASVAGAKAALDQAQTEYDANVKLAKNGFTTETKVRQMRAALDGAKANLEQAELELSRINVRANASGIVQDPIASVGDVLNPGGTCVTLNDSDPMYFTGQIAEREVALVQPGMDAGVRLVSGEVLKGKVSYIAPAADPQTRTFVTEIELATNGKPIRDGLTATARVLLPPTPSFLILPSWVTLSDSGEVGLKLIDDNNQVTFRQIAILSQSSDGFWVKGLEDGDRIITLGQEYVVTGETVDPIPDPVLKAELEQ